MTRFLPLLARIRSGIHTRAASLALPAVLGLALVAGLSPFLPAAGAEEFGKVTPEQFGYSASMLQTWLLFIVAILQVVAFFRRKPPIEAEFATKTELNLRMDGINRKLESNRLDLANRIDHLTERVDGVVESVSAVAGELRRIPGGPR